MIMVGVSDTAKKYTQIHIQKCAMTISQKANSKALMQLISTGINDSTGTIHVF